MKIRNTNFIYAIFFLATCQLYPMEKHLQLPTNVLEENYSTSDLEKDKQASDHFALHIFQMSEVVLSNPLISDDCNLAEQIYTRHLKALKFLTNGTIASYPAQHLLGILAEEAGNLNEAKKFYGAAAKGGYLPATYRLVLWNLNEIAQSKVTKRDTFNYRPAQALYELYQQHTETFPYDVLNLNNNQKHKERLVRVYKEVMNQKIKHIEPAIQPIPLVQVPASSVFQALQENDKILCKNFSEKITGINNKLHAFKRILQSHEYKAIQDLSDVHNYPACLCAQFWAYAFATFSSQQLKQTQLTRAEVKNNAILYFKKVIQTNFEGLTEAIISFLKIEAEKAGISFAYIISEFLKDSDKENRSTLFYALQDYVCGHYLASNDRERVRNNFTTNYPLIELLLRDENLFSAFDLLIDSKDLLKCLTYDDLFSYLLKQLSPKQLLCLGKLMRSSHLKELGKECVRQAAENSKKALWFYARLLLEEDAMAHVEMVIELLKDENSNLDKAYQEDIKSVLASIEHCAAFNKKVAAFLSERFKDGWAGIIMPDIKKTLVYQLQSLEEEKPQSALLQAKLFIQEKDYTQALALLINILSTEDNEIIKETSDLLITINPMIPRTDQYNVLRLLLPLNKDGVISEFIRIERELQDQKQNDGHEMGLLAASGFLDDFKKMVYEDGRIAYNIALAFALRIQHNLLLLNSNLENEIQEIFKMIAIADQLLSELDPEYSTLQELKLFVEHHLGMYYFSIGNEAQAAYYLKPSVKQGNKQAMASYGVLCLKGLIELPGIDTRNYGLEMLKEVLRSGEAKVSVIVRKSISTYYRATLNEQIGTNAVRQTRKDYLELVPLLGKEEIKFSEKIMNDMRYYSFDEVMERYQEAAVHKDAQALNEVGLAYCRSGNNKQAQQHFVEATEKGCGRAHFNLAMMIHEKKIYGSASDIIDHVDKYLKHVVISKKNLEKEHEFIEFSRYLLANLSKNSVDERVFEIAAGYDFKLFELTRKKIYIDSAAHILTNAEMILFGQKKNREDRPVVENGKNSFKMLIDNAEKMTRKYKLSDLAFSLGVIHQSRFAQENPFLNSYLEHLSKAQEFFKCASEYGHKKKDLCFDHLSDLYYYNACLHVRNGDFLKSRQCFETSLQFNAKKAKVLFMYAKLLIEHYKKLNFSEKRGYSQGVEKLKKAISLGCPKAQGYLAHHYMAVGLYGPAEKKVAFKLMLELANSQEKMCDAAKLDLAVWLLDGKGCVENPDEAKKCLLSASRSSDELNDMLLGICYYKLGIKYGKREYFEKAAEIFEVLKYQKLLSAVSHLFLSKLYISGVLGLINLERAIQHFKHFLESSDNVLLMHDQKILEYGNNITMARDRVEGLKILDDLARLDDPRIGVLLGKYYYVAGCASQDLNEKVFYIKQIKLCINRLKKSQNQYPELDFAEEFSRAYASVGILYASLAINDKNLSINAKLEDTAIKLFAQQAIGSLFKALKNNCDGDGNCRYASVETVTQEIMQHFVALSIYKPQLAQVLTRLMNIIYAIWHPRRTS